ncbi:MAG: hypothetical protein ACYTEW_25715, partial [Planctomycetota bacterium]
MSVRYVDDVATARFDTTDLLKGESRKKGGRTYDEEEEYMREIMALGGKAPKYMKRMLLKKGKGGAAAEAAKPGFVVAIAGYSPYKNLGELMDPLD